MNYSQYKDTHHYRDPYASVQSIIAQNRGGAESRIVSIEKETDNVYVNVVIDHEEPRYVHGITGSTGPNYPTYYLTGEDPEDAEYIVTKTEPILDKCGDFYCSVIRFTIPLEEIPILICPIVPNQADPNLTPLIIGIEYGSTRYPLNIIYTPKNTLLAPTQNQPLQVITPYYFIYSYELLISMINTALAAAFTNSGLQAIFPNYLAPYFFLDPTTNLLSLVTPALFGALVSPAAFIPRIFMNAPLASYLDAFNTLIFGYDQIQGNDIYFVLNPTKPENDYYPSGVAIPTPTNPGTTGPAQPFYFKYTQDFSVLEYWTSLRKIVLTSNMIPVRNEYLAATDNTSIQNLQGDNFNTNTAGINVSYPILTDFVPTIDQSAGISRSIAYYVPTGQYRLIDLQADTPLQKIDVKIYWQDRDGNFYPIPISVFQQASIKLAFFRKTLYKGIGHLLK